jgi:hypothetical protein
MKITKDSEKYTTIIAGLLNKATAVEEGFYGKDVDWEECDTKLWAAQLRSAASKIAAGQFENLTPSEKEEIEFACVYYGEGYETLVPAIVGN